MKMMQGAFFLPCSNRSRTRLAPTPTNISTKSEPEIEKNGTLASPAIAGAAAGSCRFPAGRSAARLWECGRPAFGISAARAEIRLSPAVLPWPRSTPATSLNVTFFCCVECSRARLLPKLSALLPPLCICRIMKIQNASNTTNGEACTRIETQPRRYRDGSRTPPPCPAAFCKCRCRRAG